MSDTTTFQDNLGEALSDLIDVCEFMNEDEQEVMATLVEICGEIGAGVVRGQKIYGYMDLMNDDRDHLAESEEEDRDWVTYRLMHFVKERRKRLGLGKRNEAP